MLKILAYLKKYWYWVLIAGLAVVFVIAALLRPSFANVLRGIMDNLANRAKNVTEAKKQENEDIQGDIKKAEAHVINLEKERARLEKEKAGIKVNATTPDTEEGLIKGIKEELKK